MMLDLNYLSQLFNHDERLIEKFLSIFKEQTPHQLRALAKFVEDKNWEQVALVAHSLKSQVKYLSLPHLATLAYQIEQRAELKRGLNKIPLLSEQLQTGLLEIVETMN